MKVVMVRFVGLNSLRVWLERRYGCRSADAASLDPGDERRSVCEKLVIRDSSVGVYKPNPEMNCDYI